MKHLPPANQGPKVYEVGLWKSRHPNLLALVNLVYLSLFRLTKDHLGFILVCIYLPQSIYLPANSVVSSLNVLFFISSLEWTYTRDIWFGGLWACLHGEPCRDRSKKVFFLFRLIQWDIFYIHTFCQYNWDSHARKKSFCWFVGELVKCIIAEELICW